MPVNRNWQKRRQLPTPPRLALEYQEVIATFASPLRAHVGLAPSFVGDAVNVAPQQDPRSMRAAAHTTRRFASTTKVIAATLSRMC